MRAAKLRVVEQPYREMKNYMDAGHIGRQADGGLDGILERIKAEGDGRIRPIRVPWRDTNQTLGYGFTPGQVTIVAGSAGVAKSYLLLNILRHAGENGFRWRLLPLEDDAGRWIQRMLAVHLSLWAMVAQPENDREETRRQVAERKLAALEDNKLLVAQWYESIFENPRLPVDDGSGALVSRDVHYRDVLAFLEGISEVCDLVGLDCRGSKPRRQAKSLSGPSVASFPSAKSTGPSAPRIIALLNRHRSGLWSGWPSGVLSKVSALPQARGLRRILGTGARQ